ncbi:hypothetical protein [Halalkalicoccus sp. NIPERK01]|uniref:AtuA-related protein n=1 Tax=Halalkalicoccus sp. NIPERK01 TaxID=3053469 RepID=UPI00256E9B1B|nr:hypothetical protein [Halalkalicoccus sp. NIPERK01]MDL5362071.1 hypothetical protein [Halalkalicoccus sp. NIPERK01]
MTQVRELAHARAGDKGDTLNIAVFANNQEAFERLEEELTAEIVEETFDPLISGTVERYTLPELQSFNFVLYNALAGGVTTSLRIDSHGKSLSYVLLGIELS